MQRPSPRFRSQEYFIYETSEEMFYPNLWRTETNRHISYRVLLQKRAFILRGTHKH